MAPRLEWRQRRRDGWLRRRMLCGLNRPWDIITTSSNADSVSAGPARAERIVMASAYGTDLLGVVEAYDADVAALLPDFDVAQDASDDAARRGCALAVYRNRGRIDSWTLRPELRPVVRGRRVRMRVRFSLVAQVTMDPWTSRAHRIRVKVGHNAPPRFPALQRRWFGTFGTPRCDLYLGDGNAKASVIQRVTRRKVRQTNVMFVAARWWWPMSPVEKVRVPGADHDGARVKVW